MPLRGSPFRSRTTHHAHRTVWRYGLRPAFERLDALLSLFVLPLAVKARRRALGPGRRAMLHCRAALCALWLAGQLLMLTPMALASFAVLAILLPWRRPFVLRQHRGATAWPEPDSDIVYKFLTFNACCLPEVGARVNNLCNMPARARRMGQRLCNLVCFIVRLVFFLPRFFHPQAERYVGC